MGSRWLLLFPAYLASPKVGYTNVLSGATWKEKIGMQAWYALYNRGYEAWTSYRRLDLPQFSFTTNCY